MLGKIKNRIFTLSPVKRYALLAVILLITMTVAFIFSNSMKPPAESTSDSDTVKEIISSIIPPESNLGQLILNNIRKIAHFTEYGLLGIEVSCFIFLLVEKRSKRYIGAAKSLLFALVVGFCDETVQIFSSRGPMIQDVWIDVGGFFTYALLANATLECVLLVKLALKKLKEKRNFKNGKNN